MFYETVEAGQICRKLGGAGTFWKTGNLMRGNGHFCFWREEQILLFEVWLVCLAESLGREVGEYLVLATSKGGLFSDLLVTKRHSCKPHGFIGLDPC